MLTNVAPLAEIFGVNNWLFDQTFENISDNDLLVRPSDKCNSVQFIAGHVTSSRIILANMLGEDIKDPFGTTFHRGSKAKESSEYPAVEEIRKVWADVSVKLMNRLENLTEAEIQAQAPGRYPVKDETMLGAITFLALHESFHMGQFSYARRFFDADGLAG
jgi:uncharacterized damage-inducible protein DinB